MITTSTSIMQLAAKRILFEVEGGQPGGRELSCGGRTYSTYTYFLAIQIQRSGGVFDFHLNISIFQHESRGQSKLIV
jgi:hypothetical protein